MLKLHDYNFAAHIHLFEYGDRFILLDVNSGSIHLLDEISKFFIERIINEGWPFEYESLNLPYDQRQINETLDEIEDAYDSGSLFTEPLPIEIDYSQMAIKSLCLNVAHACNMRCHYCFASQGSYGDKVALMPSFTARDALDFLVAQSGDVRNLEIDFFGGEPLLNMDVVKQTVVYGRHKEKETGKKLNFTMTTNGLLLNDDIMDFLIAQDISVVLSLDGRQITNDAKRVLHDGSGSYETIVPNFQQLVRKEPASYYIRGTFTRDNLDFSSDLEHMISLGFTNLSLEPAIGQNDFSITKEDLSSVVAEYNRLTNVLLKHYHAGLDINFFHYNLDLQNGPCLAKRNTGCGAGIEYVSITPNGDIYPCHQFVGHSDFIMGNINERYFDQKAKNQFAKNNLTNKPECRQCWARFYCGGGCHANNYFSNGDLQSPATVTCTMHRTRIEQAIFLDIEKKLASNNISLSN